MTTPESLRADLGKVSQGLAATGDATANINAAAQKRMAEIDSQLAEVRGKAIKDSAAAEEYGALIHERGVLALVLGEQPAA